MTAGAGILHEEFHSPAFSEAGGVLEVAQLWVNLPAKKKMTVPTYQAISSRDIPVAVLPNRAGTLRVIAGEFYGYTGAAKSFTPMNVWDLRLSAGGLSTFTLPDGWNAMLAILHGTVLINGSEIANEMQLVVLDNTGQTVSIEARSEVTILLLNGQRIDEPVVGYGPFVMNSQHEIEQAITDFNSGDFGKM